MKKGNLKEVTQKEKVDRINKVSKSFCLAKWTQVTLDLLHGTNHSCHHPKRHAIDEAAVLTNPWALHNTAFKKEVREEMLRGIRPKECDYCWNIEDTPGEHYSDRIVKSLDPWSYPYFQDVLDCGSKGNYAPHYLEVMFDNACNFSCSYCLADISSSIKKEMQEFGPYPVQRSYHRMEDPEWKRSFKAKENPFVLAFWKWLPEIWDNLHVFRITGGEPLLSKHTYNVLNYCLDHPQKKLELAVNSNLGVERDRIERFLSLLKEINQKKAIKSFSLYASVDSVGAQAEYIREGLNYDTFLHNLQIFLESQTCEFITVMVTFSIFSLPKIDKLILEIEKLKKSFPNLILDMSYLREPEYLRANIGGSDLHGPMISALEIMDKSSVFDDFEKNKCRRIFNWLREEVDESERDSLRADFFGFVNEYDKRYKKSFLNIFPELKEFFIECKRARFLFGQKP